MYVFDCLIQNYQEVVLYSQLSIFLLFFTSVYRNLGFNWNGLIFSSFLFSLAFFRVRRFCIPYNSSKKIEFTLHILWFSFWIHWLNPSPLHQAFLLSLLLCFTFCLIFRFFQLNFLSYIPMWHIPFPHFSMASQAFIWGKDWWRFNPRPPPTRQKMHVAAPDRRERGGNMWAVLGDFRSDRNTHKHICCGPSNGTV